MPIIGNLTTSWPKPLDINFSSYETPSFLAAPPTNQVAAFTGNGFRFEAEDLNLNEDSIILSDNSLDFKGNPFNVEENENGNSSLASTTFENNDPNLFGLWQTAPIDNPLTNTFAVENETNAIINPSTRTSNSPPMSQPPALSDLLLPLPETLTPSLIPGDDVEPLLGGIEPPPLPKTNFTFDWSTTPKQQRLITKAFAQHPEFETIRNYAIHISAVEDLYQTGILVDETVFSSLALAFSDGANEVFADMLLIDKDFLTRATTNNLYDPNDPKNVDGFIDQNTGNVVPFTLSRAITHEGYHFFQSHKGDFNLRDDAELERDAILHTDSSVFEDSRRVQHENYIRRREPLPTSWSELGRWAQSPFPIPGQNPTN